MDRKARTRDYKENPPPAGIYQVRNNVSGRLMIGSSTNPTGRLNRHRFALRMRTHPDRELQSDWNELGEDAFEFTVLDHLDPVDDATSSDPVKDLVALESMWVEKLRAAGASLYGRPAAGR